MNVAAQARKSGDPPVEHVPEPPALTEELAELDARIATAERRRSELTAQQNDVVRSNGDMRGLRAEIVGLGGDIDAMQSARGILEEQLTRAKERDRDANMLRWSGDAEAQLPAITDRYVGLYQTLAKAAAEVIAINKAELDFKAAVSPMETAGRRDLIPNLAAARAAASVQVPRPHIGPNERPFSIYDDNLKVHAKKVCDLVLALLVRDSVDARRKNKAVDVVSNWTPGSQRTVAYQPEKSVEEMAATLAAGAAGWHDAEEEAAIGP